MAWNDICFDILGSTGWFNGAMFDNPQIIPTLSLLLARVCNQFETVVVLREPVDRTRSHIIEASKVSGVREMQMCEAFATLG